MKERAKTCSRVELFEPIFSHMGRTLDDLMNFFINMFKDVPEETLRKILEKEKLSEEDVERIVLSIKRARGK